MQRDINYVYVLCVVLYILTLALGVRWAETYLAEPFVRRHVTLDKVALRSGDLLLWSNPCCWYTDIEKLMCGSPYTHVSMIVIHPRTHEPFVWESTARTGNRLIKLVDVLRDKGLCVLRKLNVPVDEQRLHQFIKSNRGQRYSYNVWDGVVNRWFRMVRLPRLNVTRVRKRRFCSQLIADTYAHMGVIDLGRSDRQQSHLVLPGDFCLATDRHAFFWNKPYALGAETRLTAF